MSTDQRPFLLRAEEIQQKQQSFSHPWNERSRISGTMMGQLTGLQRTGVSWARIPPGKESFVYHLHHLEEEWLYILSGRGIIEVDGREHEVGPGDFLGFPAPSAAHHLRNPFGEDLVYLMGGESREMEIADYPKHGKRMIRHGDQAAVYDLASGQTFPFPGLKKL